MNTENREGPGTPAAQDSGARRQTAAAPPPPHGGEAMGIGEAAGPVVRHWWLAVLTALLGVLAGAEYASVIPPTYLARAYVLVVPQERGEEVAAGQFAQAFGRIAAQAEVIGAVAGGQARVPEQPRPTPAPAAPAVRGRATSPTPVPTAAATRVQASAAATRVQASAAEVRRQVHAATSPDAPVIEITGSAGSPQRAADLANLVADSLVTYANGRTAETRMRLVTLSPAYPPIDAAAPRPALVAAVGGAAGLLVGGFVVLTLPGRRGPHSRQAARRRGGASGTEPGRYGDGRPLVDQRHRAPEAGPDRMVRP